MYLFILGTLTTQFAYIAIQWWRFRYKEYLFYGAYIATFGLYAIILFQQEILKTSPGTKFFEIADTIKRPLAFLIHLEYFFFAQTFVDLKNKFPSVYKKLLPVGKIIIGFIVCEVILRVFNIQRSFFGHTAYYSFSGFLFIIYVVTIWAMWSNKDPLVKYLLWASLSLTLGVFISNLMDVFHIAHLLSDSVLNYYFIPTTVGAAFEVYFLNTGIVYKISRAEKKLISTQQELITKLKENEILLTAQQNMRNKIAQDLHDDLGATLSGIALHSHLADMKILEGQRDAAIHSLNVIRNSANEMVNNLNDVVWTVNPKNDNAGQMLERLKEYALNMTQSKNILLGWKSSAGVEDIKLTMEPRRNIYLVCKEAVNNAVKYSGCKQISINVSLSGTLLQLTIADDGRGFDLKQEFTGNGLKNMQARAKENKMKLQINSLPEKGTSVMINYEITQ